MTDGTTTWSYKYNADGLRTEKTDGTTTYKYVYSGSTLIQMTVGESALFFGYDGSTPVTVTYNDTTYYYVTNLQGDIVSILDGNGTEIVKYTYDAWGNILSTTGTLADTLGEVNPLRYRGYVYDSETDLYYLQSRYYDPEMGRFINADAYASTGRGLLGNNMFTYCNNSPIMLVDNLGNQPTEAIDTDGDGKPDCYVYEYTYIYRVKTHYTTTTWEVTGSVYIFIGRTKRDVETMGYPEGFNAQTDMLVLDLTNEKDANMYAYQAQKVSCIYRENIIKCLKQYDKDFNTRWERSESSLLTEWQSHHLFAPFDKSAQDIDFNNQEEGWGFGDYCKKAFIRAKQKFFSN